MIHIPISGGQTSIEATSAIYNSGFGYVVLPNNVPRDEYIRHCLNNNTVSMIPDNAICQIDGVMVPKDDIGKIDFPQEPEELGSLVYYCTAPKKNFPIITAIYPNQNSASLSLTKKSLYENNAGGLIIEENGNINLFSDNEKELTIKSLGGSGSLNIESSNSIILNFLESLKIEGETVKFKIGDLEQKNTEIEISEKGIAIRDANKNEIILGENVEINSKSNLNLKSDNLLSLNKGDDFAVLGKELILVLNELSLIIGLVLKALTLIPNPAIPVTVNPAFPATIAPIEAALNTLLPKYQKVLSKTILVS